MNIYGSSGIASNGVNNAITSNPPTDNAGTAETINMPGQFLSVALPEQKGINERQICAAVDPEDGGHNRVKTPETSTLHISGSSDNIDTDNSSGRTAQTLPGVVSAIHPHNTSASGTTGFSLSSDIDPSALSKGETNPGLTQQGKTCPDNPVKFPDISTLSISESSDNIDPDNTSDVLPGTLFRSTRFDKFRRSHGFTFGSGNYIDPLGLPDRDINTGFTYHGKTYLDDTDVYLIYYFNDTGSDSVQLTKQAIAELKKADPDIFQGLPCPNLLFSRHHSRQIRMSEQERILRWQPLAQLILLEEGSTNPNDRSVDLSRIFEIKGSGQDTSRQHNTERPDLFSGRDSLSYIAEICRREQEMAISSWKVAKVPFGLFRRGFYEINRLHSPSERELAGPDYEGFAKVRDNWAESRFVSQFQKLIHSSDKTSENIVQILRQVCPPASSEADENRVRFIDIASELDSQLGLGMTRFEAELISPPPPIAILL